MTQARAYPEPVTDDELQLQGRLSDRGSWRATRCSVDRTMTAIGNRTSMLILREAFYGTSRFDDFAARVGVTEPVASARLRGLVELGVLERRPYQEPGQRTRHEYVLTTSGRELLPALIALMQWGDAHLAGPDGPPLRLTHDGCGGEVLAEVGCTAGHTGIAPRDISVVAR